jgi:hypothetical protein
MKTTLNTLFTVALSCSFMAAGAQTSLPYRTGFDTPDEKSGWTQHRKGSTDFYNWGYSSGGAYSAPTCLFHDYPVGNDDAEVVTDWFVSPKFAFPSGGMVDSIKVNVFAIIGSATADDEFGIYLLKGSADPAMATVTKLADLTGMVTSSVDWEDTGKFVIPPTTGDCYIALKYRATNNWFTPKADNIVIKGAPVSIPEQEKTRAILSLFPNPANNKLNIQFTEQVQQPYEFYMYDLAGKQVMRQELQGSATLNIDLPAGAYSYKVFSSMHNAVQSGKITVK